jgi:hypothetical protein
MVFGKALVVWFWYNHTGRGRGECLIDWAVNLVPVDLLGIEGNFLFNPDMTAFFGSIHMSFEF